MHASYRKADFLRDAVWIVAVSTFVFALSQVPYSAAERKTPSESVFLGQIAIADDINSYYSFIRQAALGHLLFKNNMTYIDHDPIFVNVEWFAIGAAMRLLDLGPRMAYDVWRAFGIVILLAAFAGIARLCLATELQRRTALLACAIGGGFGWLLTALMRAGVLGPSDGPDMLNPALDLFAGIQPFVQITRNPHFSLPHGTFILTCLCIVLAEQTHRAKWYGFAALATVLHGLIRPYDLISLFAIIPAFAALECLVARKIDWRWSVMRCVPLIAAGPVLLYYVYLFSFHPVFKYWASQGDQPFVPIHWHLLSLGLMFLLFVWRIGSFRRNPLSTPSERFLAVWALSILALFHSYKVFPFMPYTPQLGVPMMTPVIVLAVSMLPTVSTSRRWVAAAALLVTVNALSTPVYLRSESRKAPENPNHYIRLFDLEAVDWLNRNIDEHDVVLARYSYGTRISQYLNARVAVGHWALSPHVDDLNPRIDAFLSGELSEGDAKALLQEIKPRYIYVDLPASGVQSAQIRQYGYALKYENRGVVLYEFTPPIP
ncbi:MAG TPA: hypothetical protein PLJ47_06155 [Candidatus Hydrogenedentes bacterium]|nr:hypothetical protein [Candidatus Hydrogenedentota bacterium]HRK34161.1 hypothetical protein [Candidatus Hydrogenedentota bacterium]